MVNFFVSNNGAFLAKSKSPNQPVGKIGGDFTKEVDTFFATGDINDEAEGNRNTHIHDEGNPNHPVRVVRDQIQEEQNQNCDECLHVIKHCGDGVAKNVKKTRLAGRDIVWAKAPGQKSKPTETAGWHCVVHKVELEGNACTIFNW